MDPQNIGTALMFECFDHTIGGCLGYLKICTDLAAALVVSTVYQAGGAIEAGENRRTGTKSRVYLILFQAAVGFGGGQILDQIPAEVDIQKLQASADPKNGLSGFYESVKEGELREIQSAVKRAGA